MDQADNYGMAADFYTKGIQQILSIWTSVKHDTMPQGIYQLSWGRCGIVEEGVKLLRKWLKGT